MRAAACLGTMSVGLGLPFNAAASVYSALHTGHRQAFQYLDREARHSQMRVIFEQV